MIKNTNSSTPSTSDDSTPNPCPICLDVVKQEAYLDRCFHKFCFSCISHWSKLVSSKDYRSCCFVECPICKRKNFSIIHGCDGDSFQQYYINQENGFSLTSAHKYRLQCYTSESGTIYERFCVPRYWRSRRCLKPNRWLQSWLRREIQALIQEEDVDIIVHHILGFFESFLRRHKEEHLKGMPEQKQGEFRALIAEAARPFLLRRTDQFVNEIELFLVSGLNIEAYDEVYLRVLSLDTSGATNNEDSQEMHDQRPQVPNLDFFDEDLDRPD